MFKTNKSFELPQKDTRPKPLGHLKLKKEKEYLEFFEILVGRGLIQVPDTKSKCKYKYEFVNGEWYLLANGKYVFSADCDIVYYNTGMFK